MSTGFSRTTRVSVATMAFIGTPFVLVGKGARGVHTTYADLKDEIYEAKIEKAVKMATDDEHVIESIIIEKMPKPDKKDRRVKIKAPTSEGEFLAAQHIEPSPELLAFYKDAVHCEHCLSADNNFKLCPVHLKQYAEVVAENASVSA